MNMLKAVSISSQVSHFFKFVCHLHIFMELSTSYFKAGQLLEMSFHSCVNPYLNF
jgi:hypothetical protein